MKKVWGWLKSKQKQIYGGLVIVAAAALVFAGKIDTLTALTLLVLAGQIAGLGLLIEDHTAQVTKILEDLAKAGVNVTVHNYGAAEKSAAQAVADGIKLAQSIKASESVESEQADAAKGN